MHILKNYESSIFVLYFIEDRKILLMGASFGLLVIGELQKIEIDNFRWHDLRHIWASWHVQRGTPLQVLRELGGWETIEMLQRYAHLSADHLTQWVMSLTEAPAAVFPSLSCNLAAALNEKMALAILTQQGVRRLCQRFMKCLG